MKRRIVVSLVFILAIGLCAGLVWFNFFRDKMIQNFFANMQPPAQTVSAAKVETKTWTPSISAHRHGPGGQRRRARLRDGRHRQGNQVQGKPERSGRARCWFSSTTPSSARICTDVQAAVKTAESNFERAKTLSSRGYGTEANFDQASALLAAARSRLARLQATIEQKALKAPFSGVIGIPRIDIGQYLQPGTVIASFQDLSSMKVDFTVPEQAAGEIKLGQEVRLGVTAADLPFKGKVIGKDPRVDPKTRLVSVQALIEEQQGQAILPGQFLHVEAILPPEPNVITVPQTAVITSLYGDYVYTIEQEEKAGQQVQVVKQVFVKTGRRRGGSLEVLSGIDARPAGRRLRAEQASGGVDRQDRQHHRRDEVRRDEARQRAIGSNSHEFHGTVHPPPRPVDGGEPPDPVARRAGADEPSGASVPGGRRDHDHDHDHLYGRERRSDAGLHQHAHRQIGLQRRRRRLRHVAEPAGPQHGLRAHAPQHGSERGADRGDVEGAAGARAAARPTPRIRSS